MLKQTSALNYMQIIIVIFEEVNKLIAAIVIDVAGSTI